MQQSIKILFPLEDYRSVALDCDVGKEIYPMNCIYFRTNLIFIADTFFIMSIASLLVCPLKQQKQLLKAVLEKRCSEKFEKQ